MKPSGTLTAQPQQRKVDFSITNSTGTIDKVTWDFGNGSTTATTGLTATYTYPTSGTYTAKATLSNSCGQETIASFPVSVADASSPTVSLQTATSISLNSAVFGMTVTSKGNANISRYGICYSRINMNPELGKDSVYVVDKPGDIDINTPVQFALPNLQPNTTYYVRSFAVNSSSKMGYSDPVQTFKTGSEPSVSVAGSPTLGVTTSTVGMVILNVGNPAAIEYGICYSSSNTTPRAENSMTKAIANPAAGANINVDLANLTPNTRYYYCAYAKLPDGTYKYSSVQSLTTQVDTLVQDLIASVSFTDGSRSDISGNNNNVNPVGNPTFTSDRKGKSNAAILLNGLGDYLYMNDSPTLNQTNAISISIWIKPISLSLDPTGWMQIYNKSNFVNGTSEMYSALIRPTIGAPGITINTDIKQGSQCQSGKWQTLTVASGIELNKWYHIVFTYSGTVGRMYINGQLLYTKTDFSANGIDYCPGGELKFGAQGKSDTNYFYGALDDIRMYRRVLTDSEVQTLFNQ
ncbi:LamG-like jellyroll fold domain-containing protein [Spirosoma jeollabukense]